MEVAEHNCSLAGILLIVASVTKRLLRCLIADSV